MDGDQLWSLVQLVKIVIAAASLMQCLISDSLLQSLHS